MNENSVTEKLGRQEVSAFLGFKPEYNCNTLVQCVVFTPNSSHSRGTVKFY